MVRYYSDDGVFDAPIQKLWKLIEAHNTEMSKIHPGIVSVSAKPEPSGSVVADITTKDDSGKTVAHKWRFIMKAPRSQTVEMVSGPLAGSWLTSTYLPEGNRTRVVTVAEWKVQGVTDESTLHKAVEEFMENGFAEDSRYLGTMP